LHSMGKQVSGISQSKPVSRRTRQRDAVLASLTSAPGPLNAQEILRSASKDSAGLGLATVYRHVKALCEGGALVEVHVPGEPPRYEPAGRAHHHHFLCTRCARLFEVEGCPGNLGHLTPKGFTLERHEITLIGLCETCSKAKGVKPDGKLAKHDHTHDHGHGHTH
jgi:Fur family transcriptional regulator, ferric uptake regulator